MSDLPAGDELVRRILKVMADNKPRGATRTRHTGVPLWSIASYYFALGSTSSAKLCRVHGFDPDAMVRRHLP